MLDVAIVGLGRWGQQLVDAVHGRSDALRFTRAVVRSLDSARAAAARFGLAATTDYDAVLADPSIKGVVLATPHSQHAAQVQRAAAAGKAVFCEKPFTLTHSEARAAASACARAGVPLCLGFNRRFLASYRDLLRRAAGGELGVLLHVEAFFGSNGGYRYTAGMWRASEAESPAGGMTGLGVHLLDAMIGLCGPVAAVRADSRKRGLIPIDDTTTAWLEFASGATGSLVTLPASAPGWHLRLSGGKGRGEMLGEERLALVGLDPPGSELAWPKASTERAELEAFAAAIGGGTYAVPVADAVHGVAVLEAIVASVARGGDKVAVER